MRVQVLDILLVLPRAVGVRLPAQWMRQLLGPRVGVLVVMPIDHRVVEADAQPGGPHCVHDLLDQVAVQHRAGVVVADARVVQREAFMVFAGEDHVPAPGLFRELCPLARECRRRLEQRDGALGVRVGVGFHALLNPLHAAAGAHGLAFPGPGQSRIQAPMHEHAEPRFPPPLHTGIALFARFRCRPPRLPGAQSGANQDQAGPTRHGGNSNAHCVSFPVAGRLYSTAAGKSVACPDAGRSSNCRNCLMPVVRPCVSW